MSDAIVIVDYDPAWPSEFVHLRHRDDRSAYTEAKTEFIEATLGLD